MPLYEGKTVGDAMRKALAPEIKRQALGKAGRKQPDRVGEPKDRVQMQGAAKTRAARRDSDPQTHDEWQEFLRPHRDAAILRAQRWLGFNYRSDDTSEIGYYETIHRRTLRHRVRSGIGAGRAKNEDEYGVMRFEYRFPLAREWEVLVIGHSHPKTSRNGMRGLQNSNDDESRSRDDVYLNRFGPLVIATPDRPGGRVFDDEQSYRSMDEMRRG